jgi:DNA sulfur modification protein DndB
MIPLGILSKLFVKEDDYLMPEFRAQRTINESRIPEIKKDILDNPTTYVFSALAASIDGDFEFISSNIDDNVGQLKIDMNAVLLINDGQHRKAAIEAALIENPDLAKESISVVLYRDEGLKRSQQMFADLNKHAVKPSKSLSTLYDDRDDLSNAVKDVINNIPFLNKFIDKEHDSLGKFSSSLFR